MKVRKCHEGTECTYADDENEFLGNEIIKCPVCSAVWMMESEHHDTCQHLRFYYYTLENEFVYFEGDWDHTSFEESFRELAHFNDDDHHPDEEQGFSDIKHPDVDTVVYWDWNYSPLNGTTGYWGYKE